MLSQSLPLSVGMGTAMSMYLEDSVMTAQEALAAGLVNATTSTTVNAKKAANDLAKILCSRTEVFFHGPISRLCVRNKIQFSQEIMMASSALLIVKKEASTPQVESVLVKPRAENEVVKVSRDEILAAVVDEVRNLLATSPSEELDHHMSLMEMGIDSLVSTQLVRQLEARLDLRLSPTLLFSYPTIDALTEHLIDQMAGRLDDDSSAKQEV